MTADSAAPGVPVSTSIRPAPSRSGITVAASSRARHRRVDHVTVDGMPAVADPGLGPVQGQPGVAMAEHLGRAGELAQRPVPARPAPPALGHRVGERGRQPEHHLGRRVADLVGPVLAAQPEHVRQRLLDRVEGEHGESERGPERGGDRGLAGARRAGHHDLRHGQRAAIM